ncbi:hypothetical protein B0T16DRAFT_384832 [Cercophora newfieldiana]|uniref:HTH La-type RNA-binding domain-containing protein n=1 Tax=Cercophora newfieldiana TaxID=92897 RepID=A0AA39YQA4_9PEZI|nr:hypothetical protein B0T16DRAFT_384832 [Cercophora newfieldiana]
MSSTTFSYAQAAKGHTVSQPSPQLTSSSAPASIKDDVPTAGTSVTAPSIASNEADARDAEKRTKSESEGPSATQDSEVASFEGSGSSTASVNEQSVKTGQESDVTMVEFQQLAEEKGSRSASRTSQGHDNKKGRKGRKGRGNDKDTQSEQNQEDEKEKDAPKPVLQEAPVPAVNFWTQRLEAQSAKAKQVPVVAVNETTGAASAGQESKKRQQQESVVASGELTNGVNGDKPHKKTSEVSQGADQGPRRSAPRGSRANEKDGKSAAALPSVADASIWPDPKSAATTTEESNRKVQEKADVTEKDGQDDAGNNKKKNWVNLDIVPTVVFNTPLPPRGSAKARGGARGGRESGSTRGGHGAAPSSSTSGPGVADRPAVASSGSKQATSRPREGSIQSRSASQPQPALPHATKNASSDTTLKDQRKVADSFDPEQSRDTAPDVSNASSKRASSMRDIRTEPGAAAFEPPHGFSRNGQERATSSQQYAGREGRSDGRRNNGYRSRGGHANGGGSHIPSNSFASNGQQYAGYTSRHNSTAPSPPPYGGQFPMSFGQTNRGRANKWSAPGQSSGRNGAHGSGFPIKAAQAAEFPVPQYGPYMYPPQLDPIIPVVKAQVEYYFSLENLCKDHYLRKRMDSQGFVQFNTVAGFKRMRDLVKDEDTIRFACSLSEHIDHVFGDDGIERLRMHGPWHNFVLSYEEREEVARNEGPNSFTFWHQLQQPYGGPVAHPSYPIPSSAGLYSGFPDDRMFPPVYGNGIHYDHTLNGGADLNGHGYGTGSQLSAAVQEFSPPQSPVTLETMTNFSNAEVDKMMIVLGFDNNDPSGPSDVADGKVYLADHAAQDVMNGGMTTSDAPSTNGTHINDAEISTRSKKPVGQPYNEIRQAALEARKNAQPGETPASMRNLYRFWSQMLPKDFNSGVYTEFRDLAIADVNASTPALCGVKHLLEFYRKLIYDTDGRKPWPQGRAMPGIFQLHYNEALELERAYCAHAEASI